MPQESLDSEKKKSKQRFSGRRRNYVDSFRWGFVSEESDDTAPQKKTPKAESPKIETEKPKTKKTTPPPQPDPTDGSVSDSPPKTKRSRRRKKTTEAAAPEPVAPTQPTSKAKHSKSEPIKHTAKTPAGRIPKQPTPTKHTPKSKGRTKTVLPPYVTSRDTASHTYDEDDEDLRLPSYGRTPIPTDDELPVPHSAIPHSAMPHRISPRSTSRNTRKQPPDPPKTTQQTEPKIAPATPPPPAADTVVSSVSGGFRLRREQMVWDPEKQQYVPLVVKPPEPEFPKKPTKRAETSRPAKDQPDVTPPVRSRQHTKSRKTDADPLVQPKKERPPKFSKRTKALAPKTSTEPPLESAENGGIAAGRKVAPYEESVSVNEKHPPRYGDSRRGDVSKFVESPLPDPADIEAEVSGFAELGVSDTMLEALRMVQYLEPTPIQAGVFQKVQTGTDLMGQAQTGTGKTAAFMMPIIEGVETCPPGSDPVALVLVPTRELAVQVRDEAMRLSYGREVHITACYGGKPLAKQIERLKSGIDIVVGTPGRILDLMNRRALLLDSLRWVVLDEADRMLDIGFRPDIEKILRRTPPDRQTLLFSATLPPPVVRLAEKYMKSPEVLDFSNKGVAVDTIEQFYITVDPERKFDALVYLLNEQQPQQAIIFTRTKRGADRLARLLSKQFDKLAAIHGDLQQSERDKVMAQFRAGSVRYLVATDVVGRGIDVSSISHIINYDIPKFCDDYIHRVGRTGRMGREGVAFTFVTSQEGSELTRIEMRIDKLLHRAELKGFESFTKPHDPNTSLEDELQAEPPKPVFGKPIRKVRRAL